MASSRPPRAPCCARSDSRMRISPSRRLASPRPGPTSRPATCISPRWRARRRRVPMRPAARACCSTPSRFPTGSRWDPRACAIRWCRARSSPIRSRPWLVRKGSTAWSRSVAATRTCPAARWRSRGSTGRRCLCMAAPSCLAPGDATSSRCSRRWAHTRPARSAMRSCWRLSAPPFRGRAAAAGCIRPTPWPRRSRPWA